MTDTIQERARELAQTLRRTADPNDKNYMYSGDALNLALEALKAERRQAEEEMKQKAAKLVEHHPFVDGASSDCADSQGCCEVIAEEIRNLPLSGDE